MWKRNHPSNRPDPAFNFLLPGLPTELDELRLFLRWLHFTDLATFASFLSQVLDQVWVYRSIWRWQFPVFCHLPRATVEYSEFSRRAEFTAV